MLAASPLLARKPPQDLTNWDNLKTLAPDQDVRVFLKDGTHRQGKIQLLTDAAILVRLDRTDQTFARPDILRVSAKGESHRSRNALIGTVVTLPAGIVPGGVVGALIPTGKWKDVYQSR
jgi:hypothetical protein